METTTLSRPHSMPPEERLQATHTAHAAFRPAYDYDPDMQNAWFDALREAPNWRGKCVLDALPQIEAMYELAGLAEDAHMARMKGMSAADAHRHLDIGEARSACRKALGCLPVESQVVDAMRPFCDAATRRAASTYRQTWSWAGPAMALNTACGDLRRAVNASAQIDQQRGIAAMFDRHSLHTLPYRLTKAVTSVAAEAIPVILQAAPADVGEPLLQHLSWCLNREALPVLARSASNLQTAQHQASETKRWATDGWGLLPQSVSAVSTVFWLIAGATSVYAPATNANVWESWAEIAGEVRSVEDALARLAFPKQRA